MARASAGGMLAPSSFVTVTPVACLPKKVSFRESKFAMAETEAGRDLDYRSERSMVDVGDHGGAGAGRRRSNRPDLARVV
jgi:hypothetical protein